MGLSISHGVFSAPYSRFMAWRKEVANLAGFPPLELMEGFWDKDAITGCPLNYLKIFCKDDVSLHLIESLQSRLPIKWDLYGKHPLIPLLTHSDCDGYIKWSQLKPIKTELEKLLPLFSDDGGSYSHKAITIKFIEGLENAIGKKERILFR